MRIGVFGLMGLLLNIVFLLEEIRQVMSHESEKKQTFDLLYDYLQLHDGEEVITPIPAADGLSTAYLFQGNNRSVKVSKTLLQAVQKLIKESQSFTILAAVRQESKNVGSILSFGTEEHHFLEVESSGWRQELRFHYTHKSRTRTESFSYNLADNQWHLFALSVVGATNVKVLVDCRQVFERRIPDLNLDEERLNETHLWIGQRNTRHVNFKGAMEYVKLVFSETEEGYLTQCPSANVGCPTCSQFQQLQLSIQKLESLVSKLNEEVKSANERILELEKCQCKKQCKVDGRLYKNGDKVELKESCQTCKCQDGNVTNCKELVCPEVECENPVVPNGRCCPVCYKKCFYNQLWHHHGSEFYSRGCVKYSCDNGAVKKHISQKKRCPPLDCDVKEQVDDPDRCCKVCINSDFCSMDKRKCPENSYCISLNTTSTCDCKPGFFKISNTCQDKDECKISGGHHGHHCGVGSRCVNNIGSYTCECLPGYIKESDFICKDNDECNNTHGVPDRHLCDAGTCVNTEGSYYCECLPGYINESNYTCKGDCKEPCRNGGHCAGFGVCRCRQGYRGKNCDTDVDECIEGIATCHSNSVCINVPGTYYCQCKKGYHSKRHDNTNGALCQDVDECHGWGGGQHCPASDSCRNTDGGYDCLCARNTSCSPGCLVSGTLYNSGDTWQSENKQCTICHCEHGKVTCRNEFNDCSVRDSDSYTDARCCHTCQHQELQQVYRSGERWRYQCDICECHNGDRYCWPMECPKLDCYHVVQEENECCPRCLQPDPCNPEHRGNSSLGCLLNDEPVPDGHYWIVESDHCSICECQGGNICCSYDHICGNGMRRHHNHHSHHQPEQQTQKPFPTKSSNSRHQVTRRTATPRTTRKNKEGKTEDNG